MRAIGAGIAIAGLWAAAAYATVGGYPCMGYAAVATVFLAMCTNMFDGDKEE